MEAFHFTFQFTFLPYFPYLFTIQLFRIFHICSRFSAVFSKSYSGEVIGMPHFLQVLFLSVFMLRVVMHGAESQVPGDLRQPEILKEQDFKSQ
jgi:hypothetical protein